MELTDIDSNWDCDIYAEPQWGEPVATYRDSNQSFPNDQGEEEGSRLETSSTAEMRFFTAELPETEAASTGPSWVCTRSSAYVL